MLPLCIILVPCKQHVATSIKRFQLLHVILLTLYSFYYSGRTLRDFLEALPREWISEDLMEALLNRGVHLSPTT